MAVDPAAGLSASDPLSPPIYRRLRERPDALPREIAALMVGVLILTVVGWLLNRAAGVPVPLWSGKEA